MSATRSHSSSAKSGAVAAPGEGRRKRLLVLSIVMALFWSLSLFVMDFTNANRAVVSRDQVRKSDCLVIARAVRPGEDRVRVERVFRGEAETGDVLRVLNLNNPAGRGVMIGEDAYVLPLRKFRGDYIVTTLDAQTAPPLVSPAVPDVIDQVKAILREDL